MKSADLLVNELGGYTLGSLQVKEVLFASPHAILHLKITSGNGAPRRITTEVRAMSPNWWPDRFQKIKAHDFYRRMHTVGRKHGKQINAVRFDTFQEAVEAYDLEPLMKANEKSMNAWMTLMGHNAEMAHEDDFRAAREARAAEIREAKRTQEAVIARERAATDADWGMF
jgi:hypothetical protein